MGRGGSIREEWEAYDVGGDAHAGELFFVICAGLGAVVCDEDDAFACGFGRLDCRWRV